MWKFGEVSQKYQTIGFFIFSGTFEIKGRVICVKRALLSLQVKTGIICVKRALLSFQVKIGTISPDFPGRIKIFLVLDLL